MSLHELFLLAGLLQMEVNGVSIVRLAGVRLDAAQGGLGAQIALIIVNQPRVVCL